MTTDPPQARPPRVPAPWWSDPRLLGAAAFGLSLAFALRHHCARFDVETDFLWEYAPHAAKLMRGELPASFPYRGPGYHLLLALAGLVLRDLFLAGRLLSAAALGVMTGVTAAAARRAWGPMAAPAAALLLVAQPLVLLFGWSVGTDMVFAALATLAAYLLVPPPAESPDAVDPASTPAPVPATRRLVTAGLLAGYAWLARPNGLYLLPAGLTILWLTARRGDRPGPAWRPLTVFAAAFLVPTALWLIVYRTAFGHWPVTYNYRNLAAATLSEMRAMTPDVYRRTFETEIRSLGELLQRRGGTLFTQSLKNGPGYLYRFAVDIAGPVALAAVAGLAMILAGRRRPAPAGPANGPRIWALPIAGLWSLAILAPLYYEPRFGLTLAAPIAFLGAALMVTPADDPRWRAALFRGAVILLAVIGLALGGRASTRELQREAFIAPIYQVGRELRAMPDPPGGVCARKPHISFVSGRPLVGFPDAELTALPDSLRARHASWLYFGPVELELLPQYAGLVRPGTIPPGLTLVRARGTIPFGLLFRVEPDNRPSEMAPDLRDSLMAIDSALQQAGLWARIEARLATDAFHRGVFLLSRGRYSEAVPVLQAAVANAPGAAEGHLALGQALLQLGHNDESLASIEQARRLGGDGPDLHLALGRARMGLKQYPEAARALGRSLELEPKQPYAHYYLGLVEAEQGRFPEAEAHLDEALRLGLTDDASFRAARARLLLLQERYEDATRQLDEALRTWPTDLDLLLLRGFTAQQQKRPDEARSWYEKARATAPDDPRPGFYLESLRK